MGGEIIREELGRGGDKLVTERERWGLVTGQEGYILVEKRVEYGARAMHCFPLR